MGRLALYLFCMALLTIVFYPAGAALAAQGGFTGQAGQYGGFTGPGTSQVTIEQAKGMWDDSHVTLRGNIIQHLGSDKYLFRDATGTVTVEIDHDKWAGQSIAPGDTVEIYGEVDKDFLSVEIDVDRVIKLQTP